MISYLEKYEQLPLATKQRFSSPTIVSAIKELEQKYQIVLGVFVIKLLVKEIPSQGLAETIAREFFLPSEQAQSLATELRQNIFSIKSTEEVADYLPQTTIDQSVEQLKKIDQKISEIISKAKINFASSELEERFKKILSTYLRGIREKVNARESLMKDVESGGLGFDINSANSILSLAKDEPTVAPIKQPISWMPAEIVKPTIARDVEYDLAASIKAKQAQDQPLIPASAVIPAKTVILEPPVPVIMEAPIKEIPIVKEPEEVVAKDSRPRTESGKIKMEDIQISPKVYTPVDELKYMTVKNFRNLSNDPVRAMEVIKKKIEVLGQEDYGKKVEGVAGWKASPINHMYIEAYQEAIGSGVSVEDILTKRRTANPDYITSAEFEAILAFNQEINKLIH
jgi:hypothetical protein